jgi:hypothetical protein
MYLVVGLARGIRRRALDKAAQVKRPVNHLQFLYGAERALLVRS